MIKFWFNSLTINTLVGLNLMNWATQIFSEKYVNIVILKPYSDTAIQILIKDLIRPINIKILYFSIFWFFYMSKAILWCMHVAIWRPCMSYQNLKGQPRPFFYLWTETWTEVHWCRSLTCENHLHMCQALQLDANSSSCPFKQSQRPTKLIFIWPSCL